VQRGAALAGGHGGVPTASRAGGWLYGQSRSAEAEPLPGGVGVSPTTSLAGGWDAQHSLYGEIPSLSTARYFRGPGDPVKSMNATGTPHAPEWCTLTIRPPCSAGCGSPIG
jgi:hypothetical protein